MGIAVEFNPDLALRSYKEFLAGRRETTECLPQKLKVGQVYKFKKKGQRNYWLQGEVPLLETKGNQILSRPLASVRITHVSHFLFGEEVFTEGFYQVVEVFDPKSPEIHFESYRYIRRKNSRKK